MGLNSHHILDFSQIDPLDSDFLGKKAQELGELKQLGIPIPDGFVITPLFLEEFLVLTGINEKIKKVEELMHPSIEESMEKLFEPIKKEIMRAHLPQNLSTELQRFYRKLSGILKEQSLNIYSSTKNKKFIVFSNVKGDANLVLKIKEIWTSHLDNPVSIIVQKNTNSKNKGKMLTNDNSIDEKFISLAKKIQKHFYFPQEVDYVIEKGEVYIIDVKPFTGIINKISKVVQQNKKQQKILVKGVSINPGIVTGSVRVLKNQDLSKIKSSEIIVLPRLNKSLYNKIKKAKAIITDTVLQTPIDILYYRKIIKAPTITGCENATKLLQNGNIITVNGATGEIYSGGFM